MDTNVLKYWQPDEFEISSYKYSINDRKNKSFNTSGSDNTKLCTYTYNRLGFRGDDPSKEGFKIMSIGDSMTEGVGVSDNETWSHQLCKLIPNAVDLNFGCGGRSNDYISRCLLTYYDLVKPDLVLVMYTGFHRRDVFTQSGTIEPFMVTDSWGYLEDTEDGREIQHLKSKLQNDNQDLVNWYKNHLLIKYFLESKKCNWLWNGGVATRTSWALSSFIFEEANRFDGEYGVRFKDYGVDGKHPGPKHNLEYSIGLYQHIYNNFRNYLPEDSETLKKSII